METDVEFGFDEWDELSNTSTIHLSYIVQTLLPIRLVGWQTVRRDYENSTESLCSHHDKIRKIITGSVAEGFRIPTCIRRDQPPRVERFIDIDILMVYKICSVSTTEESAFKEPDCLGYFDSKGTHPGYTRICSSTNKTSKDLHIFDAETGKYYFSSSKCIGFYQLKHVKDDLTDNVSIQGPAIAVYIKQLIPADLLPTVEPCLDFVNALPCTPWPKEVSAWKDRALKSKWLSQDIVQSIIDDGCHVVAVPSKNSLIPDLEWRMSFSASEGRIAREAVTDYQRQCYIYLKILRYQIMKPVSALSSYVFKSVFLHCCEKLPVDHWKTAPGNCILYMLDVTLECLRKKFVPTYFFPENNLVDHLSEEETKAAIHAVKTMRADPITPILYFTDERVIGLQCERVTFREVIKPLIDDIKRFKVQRNRNKRTSVKAFLRTTMRMSEFLLSELPEDGCHHDLLKRQEVVRLWTDLYYFWLPSVQIKSSLAQVVNWFGTRIPDLSHSIRFYHSVLSMSSEYPDFLRVRGNLACMYHSYAYLDEGPKHNAEYMKKAGELFEQVYAENKGSVIDYVTYLVKLKKFTEAEHILECFLENRQSRPDETSTHYLANEINTLENPLKQHVADCGKVLGDNISFAYYYLVKCAIEIGADTASQKVRRILEDFESHCNDKEDVNARVLLKYARTISNNEQDRKKSSGVESKSACVLS